MEVEEIWNGGELKVEGKWNKEDLEVENRDRGEN